MLKLKAKLLQSCLLRKRKLLLIVQAVDREDAEFNQTQQIQTNKLRQALPKQLLHQLDSSFQTMVGFADSAKTTISLVELTATGVRSVKMEKIAKENLVTFWFRDSIKQDRKKKVLKPIPPPKPSLRNLSLLRLKR